MPISAELVDFVTRWRNRANNDNETQLEAYFDKFFSLYIIYNRLYAEMTFGLARDGIITLGNSKQFPDKKAATQFIVQYLGAKALISEFDNDCRASKAAQDLVNLLNSGRFNIVLDPITGNPSTNDDRKLANELLSTNRAIKAKALVLLIYSIRCNMFHGHKGFDPVQKNILLPVNIILEKLVDMLYRKLTG